jgi:hypothetical protein
MPFTASNSGLPLTPTPTPKASLNVEVTTIGAAAGLVTRYDAPDNEFEKSSEPDAPWSTESFPDRVTRRSSSLNSRTSC